MSTIADSIDLFNSNIGYELEYKGFDADLDIEFLWNTFNKYGEIVPEGSIEGDSFELISPVYKVSNFLSNANDSKLKSLFNTIGRIRGLVADQDTALHFHFDKTIFNDNELVALFDFVFSSSLRPLLLKVSGRNLNGYCYDEKVKTENLLKRNQVLSSKYLLLNPNGNSGLTIEFRTFQSTTYLENFLAKAQFAISLAQFAKDNLSDFHVKNYLDFVADRAYIYGHLIQLLSALNEYPVDS